MTKSCWSAMYGRGPTATPSDASSSGCGDFGHVLHVADPPLKRRCIQVIHAVDDFCFLWVPLRSDFGVGDVEFLQARRHQDWVTQNVTIVHVPKVRQASILLQHAPRIVGSGEFLWATQQKSGCLLQSDCVLCLQAFEFRGVINTILWKAA